MLERRGHTEATVDLMRMAGLEPCGVLCELTLDDGFSLDDLQLESFAPTAEEQPDFDLDFDLSQPLDEAEQPAAGALDTSALELELESLDDSFGELKANVQEALQAPKEPATELASRLQRLRF